MGKVGENQLEIIISIIIAIFALQLQKKRAMNNQKRVRREVFYFKRWSRKNYAAFNSLHKLIVISVIALSCSFVTKPTRGVAQNDSSNLRKILEEVIITAEAPPEIENIDQLFLLHTLTPQTSHNRRNSR